MFCAFHIPAQSGCVEMQKECHSELMHELLAVPYLENNPNRRMNVKFGDHYFNKGGIENHVSSNLCKMAEKYQTTVDPRSLYF